MSDFEKDIANYVRETAHTGESYLAQVHYEAQIQQLVEKRTRLVASIEKTNPDHPSMPRAKTILAEMDAELSELWTAFLRAWKSDNGPH